MASPNAADQRRTAFTVGWYLSIVVLVLLVAAAIAGLLVDDIYSDTDDVVAALRGADLVTLLVASPLLALALWLVRRGDVRGHLLWLAMLGFAFYGYGYYVFGPTFNDLFLLHVAVFALSMVALGAAAMALDPTTVVGRFTSRWSSRVLSLVLFVTAAWLAVVYGSAVLDEIATGAIPEDVVPLPEWRVHLGYAMDLAFVLPACVIAGILLWRQAPWGYAGATAVFIFLCAFQVTFLATAASMDTAGVSGAADAIPEAVFSIVLYLVPTVVMLWGVRTQPLDVS
jgi:hypothetical protein